MTEHPWLILLAIIISIPLPWAIRYVAFGKEGTELRKQTGITGFRLYSLLLLLSAGFFMGLFVVIEQGFRETNTFISCFLFIGPLGCGTYILLARSWVSERMEDIAKEQAAYKKEQEKRIQKEEEIRQKQVQEREEKKKNAQKSWEQMQEPLREFIKKAMACDSFAAVLKLWDTMIKADSLRNREIRRQIVIKVERERFYGKNPKNIPSFLEKLIETYDPKVEDTPQPIPQQVFSKDTIISLDSFIQQGSARRTFKELLALWDVCFPEETEENLIIRKQIQEKQTI